MLLTLEQGKYLKVDETGNFEFTGKDKATKKEKKELFLLDDFYFEVYGYHIITNFEDLK